MLAHQAGEAHRQEARKLRGILQGDAPARSSTLVPQEPEVSPLPAKHAIDSARTRHRGRRARISDRARRRPASHPPAPLRALTINIGAAAALRAGQILQWLVRRQDELIVLTETSKGAGTALIVAGLQARGYTTVGGTVERDRGVVVATRLPVRQRFARRLNVTLPWRAVGVLLDTTPRVAVIGTYVPSRDRTAAKVERKRAFIGSLLESIDAFPDGLRRRLLLIGDYNVVARDHEPRLPGFFPYEYEMHDRLAELGLTPAHEICGLGTQPHSWIGRTGNGYLYDYVHVGASLHSRVERTAYLHGPRERRLTDHAAVSVKLRLG